MRKKEPQKRISAFLIILLTLFFTSFAASALILIKANHLVFVNDIESYEEKVKAVDETEEKIRELEAQVERYKKLYDSALSDNRSLTRELENAKESSKTTEDDSKTAEDNSKDTEKENKGRD